MDVFTVVAVFILDVAIVFVHMTKEIKELTLNFISLPILTWFPPFLTSDIQPKESKQNITFTYD